MPEYVSGNAAQLRAMIAALEAGDEAALEARAADADPRVAHMLTHNPQLSVRALVGRPFCGDTEPAAGLRPPRVLALVQDDNEAEIWVYGDIDSWGAPWGVSAAELKEQLDQVTVPKVTVHISSYGGEAYEGVLMRSHLKTFKGAVTTTVDAIAASAASVVAVGGDSTVMGDVSTMMIHDAWGVCVGNVADMAIMANTLDVVSNTIAGAYAAKAGGTVEQWRAEMQAERWYDAARAVDVGLADEVRQDETSDDDEDAGAQAASTNLVEAVRAGLAARGFDVSKVTEPSAASGDPPDSATEPPGSAAPEDRAPAAPDDLAVLTAHLTADSGNDLAQLMEAVQP